MEEFIEQQKRWNREKNLIAARSRQKAIDRMEKIEKPKNLPQKIKIQFKSSMQSGNDVLSVEGLGKEYPGKPLFKNVSFNIRKNERVFLLGPNGCGKSTLLKILTGRIDNYTGKYEYGYNVNLGYYDQEQEDLAPENTVIDEVWAVNEKLTQTEIRNALAMFLFKGEDVLKTVGNLSGGEKSRISLIKLMLSESNFLLLDEPTNHLDINSREVLESSLSDFDGTLLIVSHDRYFINKLATRIIELKDNSCIDYNGNYDDFLQYKSRIDAASDNGSKNTKVSSGKLEHMATKEEKARKRKLEKQIADTEKEIASIESRLKEIENQMTSDEVASDHVRLMELTDENNRLNERLEELYELWDDLQSQCD
jgi:ATP-binding cassette subfamily F protein 3